MQVSVETLSGLNRRVTVSIPSDRVEKEVSTKLNQLAGRIELDGFRRGKAPLSLVKKRYADSVRGEVAQSLIENTLYDALRQEALMPVASPAVDEFKLKAGEDFQYAVSFEVYPEIELKPLDKKTKVEIIQAEIQDKDVDGMIEKLREQNKAWSKVDKEVAKGHQVLIDFKGFIGDHPFEQGEAKEQTLEIGSQRMIPGFEDALIGHKAGETFSIDVTFPEDYQHKDMAGKEARFEIHLHEVSEGSLPELNEAFVKRFGIESGELEALRKDIRLHMERELERRLKEFNHEACFSVLLKAHDIELPLGLIDKEIEGLKHEMYHQIFGSHHTENEKIPDFPRELFEDRAKRRVHLGLLFSEYVKKHGIIADPAKVDALLERIASAYDDPKAFIAQCHADKHTLAEIEGMVVEQQVADSILEQVSMKERTLDYKTVMDMKRNQERGEVE